MDLVKLENSSLALSFDKGTARLASVYDKRKGYEFIRAADAAAPLFRISLINEDPRFVKGYGPADAKKISAERAGQTLTVNALFETEELSRITVTVTLPEAEAMSHWAFDIECAKGWYPEKFECPIVPGVLVPGETKDDALAFPCLGEGYLCRDPFPLIDGIPVKSGTGPERYMEGPGKISLRSPGSLAMQFMLYYNGTTGLYVATYDNEGCVKDFEIGQDERKEEILMSVRHLTERGDRIRYDTVVGVFYGDWHDGADIYKEWARKQYWAQSPMETRPQPEWMKKGFAVFQAGNYGLPQLDLWNKMEDIADIVNDVADRAQVPMAGLVFNYERAGGWTGPVGIFPPRDDNFEKAMRMMSDRGNYGFVYIPFGMWYADIPYSEPFSSVDELYDQASDYALRNKYNDVGLNKWSGYGWKSAGLCPEGDGLRKITADIVDELERLGCKMVQLDNWPIAPSQPCYATEHKHPRGYGQWWAKDYIKIMENLNETMTKRGSDVALTTECITEPFLHTMHLFDQRAGNMEYFGHWMPGMPAGANLIPLFNYVYNPCVGSYLAAYPECALPETTYWIRSTAKSVCQGVIPASGFYYGKADTINQTCLDYFIKAARISATLLWKYIMYGELLREPVTDAGKTRMPYFTLNIPISNELRYDRNLDFQFVSDNTVETAAFSYGGKTACVFMNISQETVRCCASIGVLKNGTVLRRFADGEPDGEFTYSPGFELEIEGLSIIVYETV